MKSRDWRKKMLKKLDRKTSLVASRMSAIQGIQIVLEVLHGKRVHFWEMDIDTSSSGDNKQTIEVTGRYVLRGLPNPITPISFSASLEMKKDNNWDPQSAGLAISFGHKQYVARWEDRPDRGAVVLVAPSFYHEKENSYCVGTSDVDRWTEPIYPE